MITRRSSALIIALLVTGSQILGVTGAVGRSPASRSAQGPAGSDISASGSDFDADGYDDLAIGAPGEDVSGQSRAGAVHVLYGSSSGLTATRSQLWHEDRGSIPGSAERGDRFGSAMAAGDFNGDDFGDLAIGVPGEDTGAQPDAGGFIVLFGSASGLTSVGSARHGPSDWTSEDATRWQVGASMAPTFLGNIRSLSVLLVGAPGYRSGQGAAFVLGGAFLLPGPGTGLIGTFVSNDPQDGARCGATVAAGDLDDVSGWDIAFGCPLYDLDAAALITDAGRVLVRSGDDLASLTVVLQDDPEHGDRFGAALAIGSLARTPALVVGSPLEDIDDIVDAGAISIMEGGPTLPGSAQLTAFDIPGAAATGDHYGAAVLIADVGSLGVLPAGGSRSGPSGLIITREGDLVVGAPGRRQNGRIGAGAVYVLYAKDGDLGATIQRWTQDRKNVLDVAESGDHFGATLSAGWFRGTGIIPQDLAIGVPGEDLGSVSNAGAVAVLRGSGDRVTAAGNQFWSQESSGIAEGAQQGDHFGSALPGRDVN